MADYMENRGCFPLCEACWSELTPETRLPFYMQLVNIWESELPVEEGVRQSIIWAVMAGG